MKESLTPLVVHISTFLIDCRYKGLSLNTQKNYKNYLDKFISWLKENQKLNLLPHELTEQDVLSYKTYLATDNSKVQSLKLVTQSYYLIALRALLGYLADKGVLCLLSGKIGLPGGYKRPILEVLDNKEIDRLLSLPDVNNLWGLRDRVLLDIIISAGLKVSQLKMLNREDIKGLLSGQSLLRAEKYLDKREDREKALFINYISRKDASRRLTVRSMERIVKHYIKEANLSSKITPESLRWILVKSLFNEKVIIQNIFNHSTEIIQSYPPSVKKDKTASTRKKSFPPWHLVEENISREIEWLQNVISTMPDGYKNKSPLTGCDSCFFRKISSLIVSGKVKTVEYELEKPVIFWGSSFIHKGTSYHGAAWHKDMMDRICHYFEKTGFQVKIQPQLNFGRADLLILGGIKPIFVEVGTVSLFKLWYNFKTMKDAIIVVIPTEKHLIEFNF